ncbi:hypothetical protein [Streptomyces sp. ITFR-6]|uniref:hypothetical protein n=1 Tax=Streptomyces sp. ITFR-6 TaxID=3075197 RepID=UPI00288B05C3|nr:hypothetical protein [Streptomyces sp. ITFR-6]WNI29224.1 hypothetical protein RLT59_10850 [Streptomyces sp. ITFR-6]
MFRIIKASEAEIAERTDLAGKVTQALIATGFTVHQDMDQPAVALGALVGVDPADDSGGGVFVQWLIDPSLSRAAAESAQKGEIQSQAFRHFSFVTEHMYATLIAILGSAGFQAVDADDDVSPYLIRVEG